MEPVNQRAHSHGLMQRSRIHPLMATAAGAVIVACGVGVAAMTGILPRAGGETAANGTPSTASAAQYAQNTTPTGQVNPQAVPPAPVKQIAENAPPPPAAAPAICHTCGTVTAVNAYRVQGHGTGIGAVGGAVAGGLVGQAFGGGNGRIATTLLGAAGGGYAGNAIERNVRSTTSYRVTVKMQDGSYRTFRYASTPPVSEGQRVHVENGVLRAG